MKKMGIAFMHLQKIKNASTLKNLYLHNYRVRDVVNADPKLADKNEELLDMGGKNYYQIYKERIAMLQEMYPQKKILREGGTPALEIITSMPRDDMEHVDVEKWKRDNLEWLQSTFNRDSERHGENVISVMYHGDEMGSVHCHAIVLPVDDGGKFNYSAFVNGREDLRKMQDSYAEKMKLHGLSRGLEGSRVSHEEVRRFYTELNQNLRTDDIPIQMDGESKEDYATRVEEFFKDVRAGHLKKIKDTERELVKYQTLYHQKEMKISSMEQEQDEMLLRYKALIKKFGDGNERNIFEMLSEQEKIKLYFQMQSDLKMKQQMDFFTQTAIDWSEKNLNPELYQLEEFRKAEFETDAMVSSIEERKSEDIVELDIVF